MKLLQHTKGGVNLNESSVNKQGESIIRRFNAEEWRDVS